MKLVEACADGECSHFEVRDDGKRDFCTKKQRYIDRPALEWQEGIIPEWCPLPEDG